MYISCSFTTAILLLGSSIGITALDHLSSNGKRVSSSRWHDVPSRLSSHIAALVPREESAPAPVVEAPNPAPQPKQPTQPGPEPQVPKTPGHAVPQGQDQPNQKPDKNEDENGPDSHSNEKSESKESGNSELDNGDTNRGAGPELDDSNNNSTSTSRSLRRTTKAATPTPAMTSSTTSSSSTTTSSSTATAMTTSTTQVIAPASTSLAATSSSVTAAAAGIGAQTPFVWVKGEPKRGSDVATTVGLCAMAYVAYFTLL